MKNKAVYAILILIAVVLIFSPLIINHSAEFKGSDDKGTAAVSQVDPGYKPWFTMPGIIPKSPEVQAFLFALQAALGGAVLGYCLGYVRGRRKASQNDTDR